MPRGWFLVLFAVVAAATPFVASMGDQVGASRRDDPDQSGSEAASAAQEHRDQPTSVEGDGSRVSSQPFVDSDRGPPEFKPRQAALAKTVARLFGDEVPVEMTARELSHSELSDVESVVEGMSRRMSQSKARRDEVGEKRYAELYAEGRWTVRSSKLISVPDLKNPGKSIERRESPYDTASPDDFIAEIGAVGPSGEPEERLVWIRPSEDAVWAEAVRSHKNELMELRAELRRALSTFFSKER